MFSSSDGGIIYTRRFYADIAANDTATGSPLLFPETVYNAPASHVAAQFGSNGEALTFVGDSTSALAALRTAWLMLASGEAETSLVVSAEELDWMSGEAYHRWRIGRYFQSSRTGAVLAEGAAALVLRAGDGDLRIRNVHAGKTYGDTRGLAPATGESAARNLQAHRGPTSWWRRDQALVLTGSRRRSSEPCFQKSA